MYIKKVTNNKKNASTLLRKKERKLESFDMSDNLGSLIEIGS